MDTGLACQCLKELRGGARPFPAFVVEVLFFKGLNMSFLAGLLSLTGPVLARALAALGFSVVVVGGVDVVMGELKAQVVGHLAQGPAAGIQLAGLSGAWVALGWLFGGVTFAVTYWSITQGRRILGVAQ
jgi:hypothetical protein